MRAAARFASLSAVFVIFTTAALSQNADAAKALLEQQFKGKVLLIRHFYAQKSLKYDAAGNVIGSPATAAWTESEFAIDKIEVKPDHFKLSGRRVAATYDRTEDNFYFEEPAGKPGLSVEVLVPVAQVTAQKIAELQKAIFATDIKALQSEVPPYWQAFFDGRVVSYKDKHGVMRRTLKILRTADDNDPEDATGKVVPVATLPSGEPLYKVGPGIQPPKAISAPDPVYDELARRSKYQGTCVIAALIAKDGSLSDVQVVDPIGYGLDDNAAIAVSKWRFSPASKDGAPVASFVQVEVSFHLY